jgi:cytochrome c-type biogenesis protein CcmH/NrfF
VRTERTTWSVFVLPFLLLVILIAFLTEVVRRRTRRTIDR